MALQLEMSSDVDGTRIYASVATGMRSLPTADHGCRS